jgi:DNA topoisomerase-1
MNLLIVESPGKLKKIRSILPEGWEVAASVGHVRDLPVKSQGVGPPDFKPLYVNTERGEQVLRNLAEMVGLASDVYLATDPDREGEAIAWHLAEALKLKDPKRVSYTEITAKAVLKALDAPRPIDMDLVRAQEGRRVLDRLYGYGVSPAVSEAAGDRLSAGRVQSPALRLVVDRERQIRAFTAVSHFGVDLYFNGRKGAPGVWKATLNVKPLLPSGEEHLRSRPWADLLAGVKELTVRSRAQTETRQAPPPPFITSTLQQAAFNALKLDPKRAMDTAQRLYEAGHITYMRTDSPAVSEEAAAEIRALAERKGWPLPDTPRVYKPRDGAQEAHEAIRPVKAGVESAGETDEERALYRMIRLRAIASQLADATYSSVRAVLEAPVELPPYAVGGAPGGGKGGPGKGGAG